MFILLAAGGENSAGSVHHSPGVVELVNYYIGGPVHHFQLQYTKPFWDRLLARFGTDAETMFGVYTPENAVPWYTVMFVIACLLTMLIVWVLKGRMSADEPGGGQQTLEVAVLTIRGLLEDIVGPHGLKYFPVVATFAILILVSNLMALVPGLMPPSASTSVTFALGISSFIYYNYIGVKENGLFGHLGHFAGVHMFGGAMLIVMGPVMFVIELISNLVRPVSLSMRLFGNIFGDEQVGGSIAGVGAPYTFWILPAVLLVLTVFASVMQTLIFTLLSMIYIGEVSHPPHDEHEEHDEAHDGLVTKAAGAVP
jgi:F-type H+-transporting ATPase subunit a